MEFLLNMTCTVRQEKYNSRSVYYLDIVSVYRKKGNKRGEKLLILCEGDDI